MMNNLMMGGMPPMNGIDPYLAQQYGLNTPADMGGYNPNMQDPAMQSLMSEMGQPAEPNMMGVATPQDMLGQPVPQMSQPEFMALARQLGLVGDDEQQVILGADPMVDPGYNDQYDIMSLLGGAY